MQTTVVVLNSNGKSAGSPQSVTTTTFFPPDSPVKPKPPRAAFGAEWLSLLRAPVNIRRDDGGMLKFSRSLNDMGQKMDTLCSGLHFIDRTCSDSELATDLDAPAEPDGHSHSHGKACPAGVGKPPLPPSVFPFASPSFSTNYKFVGGQLPPEQILSAPPVPVPLLPPLQDPQQKGSSNLLRFFFPFTQSPTAGSLQHCTSELSSSLASRLQITKSASALLEGTESFCTEEEEEGEGEVGEDEVFEEEEGVERPLNPATAHQQQQQQHWQSKLERLHAPLCSLEGDSDLDPCPSPMSEKTVPLSPFSLSGDCCRWVL